MANQEYTEKEILEMEVFTHQKAKNYVEEKTKAGEGLWKECIRPRLTFWTILKNLKRKRYAHEVVPKVDNLIIKLKRGLLDNGSY